MYYDSQELSSAVSLKDSLVDLPNNLQVNFSLTVWGNANYIVHVQIEVLKARDEILG